MKKVIISGVVVVAALAGIFMVLHKNKAKNEAETAVVAEQNAGVAVRTEPAAIRTVSMQYAGNGVFSPWQEVMIAAETSGRVARVLVKEGAHVSAGQILAVIEADKQNVTVSNAQAVFNNARSEVERFENAFVTGGVTKQQLDQMKLQLENAKNNLKSAQLTAGDVNIRASFAGIVNKRTVEPGAYVSPGQQLFEIVNVNTLKLRVNVDEKNIAAVKTGQQVKIGSAVLPDQSWTGTVAFIAPKADASLNFAVELEVKQMEGSGLKAGMYGTAYFGGEQSSEAFVVPRNAFVGNISSNQVFVAEQGKAVLKRITAGRNFGDYIEVIAGLEKDAAVITSGQINLADQTPVTIIK